MTSIIRLLINNIDILIFLGAAVIVAFEKFVKWRAENRARRELMRRRERAEQERGFASSSREPDFVPKESEDPQAKLRELLKEYEESQAEALDEEPDEDFDEELEEEPDLTEEVLLEEYEERSENAERELYDDYREAAWRELYAEVVHENEKLQDEIARLNSEKQQLESKLSRVQSRAERASAERPEAETIRRKPSRSQAEKLEPKSLLERAERGVVWAKILDEPRFKRPWRASVR